MHAVLINLQSLDLVATNNGGVKPDVEAWGSYFILPTNPNDHAEIVSAESFDKNYEFIGPASDTEFRPIKSVIEFVKNEPYSISRDLLARMVAAHTSGMYNAIPEQSDFDLADKMTALLESKLNDDEDEGPCPRCKGDHSWCQNVQPGEFGGE